MSQVQGEAVPSTIDFSVEITWPDKMPPAPSLPAEPEPETQPLIGPEVVEEPAPGNWIQLLQDQEERYQTIRAQMLEQRIGYLYSHFVNVETDWALEGTIKTCRVQGLSCYGRDYPGLRLHLRSATHLNHDASLAPRVRTPSPTPDDDAVDTEEVEEPPAKKVKVENTTEGEEVKRYPLWMVIPDSEDEGEENFA
ncbi:hypothetical protein FALBO_15347 [Fusarium albosuccineum]|uniref:Uncharacterized protein n=1 Tax=Fusarium albosuccineum TaxID=1237068 RepID=A0A8H4PDK7_9HYPO|nr:hypothetical protein FALBO_15347 [Fusarium albosuccineum]